MAACPGRGRPPSVPRIPWPRSSLTRTGRQRLWSSIARSKTAEAIAALREILAARKNISAAYVDLSIIYRKEHALDDAVAVLRLGVEAMPGNCEVHFQDIVCLYESGRFDEALGAFETRNFPPGQSSIP